MAKSLSDWLTYMMAGSRPNHNVTTTTKDIDPMYNAVAPFALGSADTEKNIRRHRKDIYTKWEIMLKDPSIAEAMGIHATAALGGHEARSTMIFVTPKEQYRKSENNHVKQIRRQLEEQRKCLEPMINNIAVKLCRDAISFGDGYVRVYGEKGKGVSHLVCNEYTYPPLVQAYEQADKNIGFHVLERRHWQRTVSQLNRVQMLRMKMPRVSIIPQMEIVEGLAVKKMLETDNVGELPVLPAHIGGSFLYEIEDAWWNVNLTLAAMNSQQIADAVSQMFLTINMSGMPPAQQQEYKKGLEKTMASHADHIREALAGGEAIWGTQYHVLPTWDDKQILNPLGDVKGQRSAPINMEVFMVNIRRLMGGLGLDPSMVGWADMLSGGLGNGGFISTSIQTMRRSIMIRQALTEFLDQLLNLDWGYRFGEMFDEGNYPWQFDFYSDQTAAAAEAANTKQTRMNTLMLVSQSLAALKEVGLNEEENAKLLESIGGFDFEDAQALAKGLKGAPMPADGGDFGGGEPADDGLDDEDGGEDDALGKFDGFDSASALKSVDANIIRGKQAMNKAITEKTTIHRAMYRNDIGWIDFEYGSEKQGLKHIISRRTESDNMAYSEIIKMLTVDIIETIAKGVEQRRTDRGLSTRLNISHKQHEVSLIRRKGSNAWLLTAFKLK